MTRLLCVGDLHLGQGAGLYPERLDEQEHVWRRILRIARDENVDAVLHAGDMWERRKPTPTEVLAAERPLVEHKAAGGPPVIVVAGNHDTAGTDPVLALHVLAEAGLITLSTRPEVLHVFPAGVTVATLPWAPVARLVATLGGGDRDLTHQDAARLLLDEARRLRGIANDHPMPCVLLGHWSATGSALPSGLPVDDLRDVVLDTDELLAVGFDAIVAGHIHCAQGLGEGDTPAFYVGSPMPLNHGEAGQEHGVWILDLEERSAVFRPIESTRFATVGLPIETWNEDVLAGAIVRVKATLPAGADVGAEAHLATLTAYDCGARHVTIDLTVERASRARVDVDESVSVTDAFESWLTATGLHAEERAPRLRVLHRQIEEAVA